MGVQAGLWFFDGKPVDQALLLRVADAVAPYGPDGCHPLFHDSVGMIYRPFHTTKESRLESQPHTFNAGKVMMWDGRLDNRDELVAALGSSVASPATDVEIAAAAYNRWRTDCFGRFIGDWALTIWDPLEKALILARDYMAVRHLYYYATQEKIFWCSHLAPLVLLSGRQFVLNDEYFAGYITLHPDARLTPYQEIKAVPPASFVKVRNAHVGVHSYWAFEPTDPIRYKTDAEYEEHYRHLFRQSIRRRLRTDSPVLAELSGGYDSSSIVCMADDLLTRENAPAPRVDTISLFDLKEPEVDDHLYFTKVEEKRGRTGFHIDAEASGIPFTLGSLEFCPTPRGQLSDTLKVVRRKILQEGGYRVSLSGLGGDELNGQAADCRVLLGDLLAEFRFGELIDQLKAWSLLMKRPWILLLSQAFIQLLPIPLRARLTKYAQPEPWINRKFSRRLRLPQHKLGLAQGSQFCLPSKRDWTATLSTLANQMGEDLPALEEKRYPYLDRDLVDFLTAIPMDQLLRPGQRRSLMRRALTGYLPKEVLTRKTKASAGRVFSMLVEKQWPVLEDFFASPLSARVGYIDAPGFRNALCDLKGGNVSASIVDFVRGLTIEFWLRDLARRELIAIPGKEFLPLKMDLAGSQA